MSNVPPAGPKKRRKQDPDPVRLLHRNPGMAKTDYTDDPRMAVPREPEAISAVWLDHYANQSRETYRTVRAEEQARRNVRSLRAKAAEAQARALKRGIDITPEIERAQAALDDALKRTQDPKP